MEYEILEYYNSRQSENSIGLYNDGKEKHQSYEANYYNSIDQIFLIGYGSNETEAFHNLYIELDKLSVHIETAKNKLSNILKKEK